MGSARRDEVEQVLDRARRWAMGRADVVAVALVGSWARDAARPDSDVDLVVLTTDQAPYLAPYLDRDDWIGGLGADRLVMTRSWGPLTERRLVLPSGAAADPVDEGTHQVITDGVRVLHDPEGLLARLIAAVRL